MKTQVLLSTMNQSTKELINESNIARGVIINQNGKDEITQEGENFIWIDSSTKGLSVSRNLALQNATADICLLGDDDMIYVDGYEELIKESFKKSNADIICFQVEGINRKFKRYDKKEKKVNYLNALKVSSVEIAFRRDIIVQHNLNFDERFGSGAMFPMGEENIFLFDALRKKLKIEYLPIKIADLYMGESSWFKGFTNEYLHNRGAIFYRMSSKYYLFLVLQFAVRKRKLFDNLTVFQIIKLQLVGIKMYKEVINKF